MSQNKCPMTTNVSESIESNEAKGSNLKRKDS